jgi:hypothetical protein
MQLLTDLCGRSVSREVEVHGVVPDSDTGFCWKAEVRGLSTRPRIVQVSESPQWLRYES